MAEPIAKTMPGWTRPIRMPAGIEITHAAPPFALAGEMSSWRIPFTLAKDVPAGSLLKFQLFGGRNNKGGFAGSQTSRPEANGYLAAELDGGARLAMSPDNTAGSFVLALPAGGLKKGQRLTIVLGDQTRGGKGIRAGPEHVFNKFFVLYCAPREDAGHGPPKWAGGDVWAEGTQDRIVAVCTMHILGGRAARLRAYAPATARPGMPFAVLVRPEDAFGNLSHQELGRLTLSLNGNPLSAAIEKAPGSTCLRATVSLPGEGVHRLKVHEAGSGREAVTNPTLCSNAPSPVYWGMIHGHTEMSDGTGDLNHYFHQLRHEVMLDFAAPGDHDHLWETSQEYWGVTCEAVKRWHVPHEFVTFLGYEWAKWRRNGDGDRNVYYLEDDRPLYRSDDGEYPSPPDLFSALRKQNEKAIVIPHHTGHNGNFCDWKDHSPELERLVEVYQVRGSYECSEEDGNPAPERAGPAPPWAGGYVRKALALGWRVGFTAGGDDHSGHWGTEFPFGGYKQGLMSVEAGERTRRAIFQAMYDRRVVATTGARMLLTYNLSGSPMGSELSLRDKPDLAACRRLSIAFHGTAPVARVDIIRNIAVVHSIPGDNRLDLTLTWEDWDPIEKTFLPPARFCNHPFSFYYVRVVQTDGEIAWASPVWIDP